MKTYALRRFGARVVDGAILCLPIQWQFIQIAESIEVGMADSLTGSLALSAIGAAAFLVAEPVLISRFATTPGKWLFALRVLKKDGSLLSYQEAFKRTSQVITQGLGLCLRGLVLVTLAFQAFRLLTNKESDWDANLESACLNNEDFDELQKAPRVAAYAEEEVFEEEAESVHLSIVEDEEAPVAAELIEADEAGDLVAEVAEVVSDEVIAAEVEEDGGLELDLEEDKAA